MGGELLAAWPRTWKDLWVKFASTQRVPDDLFTSLVAELMDRPERPTQPTPPPRAYNEAGELIDPEAIAARDQYERLLYVFEKRAAEYDTAVASESNARDYFRRNIRLVHSEISAVRFIEDGYIAIAENYGDEAGTRFFEITKQFIARYNLRYEIRAPFALHATVSGLFSRLSNEIRIAGSVDTHLATLIQEYEEAFADLKAGRTQSRMKTCLQKQYNLLEGLGRRHPSITRNTLGAMCDQISWPHDKIKEVGKGLYSFGSDYPGVRHGGTAANALRPLDFKDFISISLMLSSFAPYLVHDLNSERCYDAN